MIFKPYECDFGIKRNGVNYDFTHVMSLQIEDSKMQRLTRGANAKNLAGLVYQEGITEPERWTASIRDMSTEVKAMLDEVFKNGERVDVYCIRRADGSSKMAKQAVLCQKPQQLLVDESPDSMNVALLFESFDTSETFKS